MTDYSLLDIWQAKNPQSVRGTFHRGAYSARLDYWLIPHFMQTPSTSIDIVPHQLSDHSLLILQVGVGTMVRGPGHWRFDNSLLADPIFREKMFQHIDTLKEDQLSDPNLRWEWFKYKIRDFSIDYMHNKRQEHKKLIKDLQDRLLYLAKAHDLKGSLEIIEEVASIKRELKEISLMEANKIIFRARAQWAMAGEKPSAYFLGLEKRKSKDMTITALKDEAGGILTSNEAILERQRSYFTEIYKEDPDLLDSLDDLPLTHDDVPSISYMDKDRLERPFTQDELYSALKGLNKGKSPGSDGLTPEFYLRFWDSLQDIYMESISFSLETGTLTEEQRTGLIKLIPKKGLDRQDVSNWRPITLLNVDFKIFSKAIAARIQTCINQIISPDQTGFIRGRYIGSNLLNIRSLIDHVDATDDKGLLLAIDYRKAFDTIRWKLIFKALDLFGFGDHFIAAVKTMFQGIKTAICNAGYSSSFFFPSRGIRQGCCASPSLFIITVELLATLVRKSIQIRGIQVAQSSFKISQYADDSTFFLKDFQSMDALMVLLSRFTKFSGLAVNTTKSHLLLLGNYRHPPKHYLGIQVEDRVKILGLIFKRKISDEEQYSLNFEPQLLKIKQICKTWANREMSLKGKVTVLKSLVISLLQYPCTCTNTPQRVFDEFKKIMVDFLWSGKKSKIAYALLVQDIDQGGLSLPDLHTRVTTSLLAWIRYIWTRPHTIWTAVLQHHLKSDDIKATLLCKTNLAKLLPPQLPFLKLIMDNWAKLHIFEPQTEEEVKQESLWHNDFITIQGNTLNWAPWKRAGIKTVDDLWHPTMPRFFSHTEIAERYGVQCSFLDLFQIRSALPFVWKRLLANVTQQPLTAKPRIKLGQDTELDVQEASSKRVYKALILTKIIPVPSQSKWGTSFPVPDERRQDYWSRIYRIPYQSVRDTKLQAFQIKLLHRIIPCNKYLKTIRIRQDDLCPNCRDQDTLQHRLYKNSGLKLHSGSLKMPTSTFNVLLRTFSLASLSLPRTTESLTSSSYLRNFTYIVNDYSITPN